MQEDLEEQDRSTTNCPCPGGRQERAFKFKPGKETQMTRLLEGRGEEGTKVVGGT